MTLQLTAIDSSTAVRWMNPASGLWVATRRGEHAGMVERVDGSYDARSARGRALGSFDDLDSARAAVDGSGIGHDVRAPRGLTGLLVVLNGAIAVVAVGLAYLVLR